MKDRTIDLLKWAILSFNNNEALILGIGLSLIFNIIELCKSADL